ncbi:MAG: SCO family protein [Gemmatimonadota bacterium]|nr:SCO family protein [Gemmatimonadota bacterium]MDE3215244.1 SCO family protein [Gemmatimonadota bacterium]
MRGWARAAALAVLVAVGVSACDRMRDTVVRMRGEPLLRGSVIGRAFARPAMTLTDTKGQAFDFARATKGRVTFITFGYTHCPDICPVHMADLAGALRRLPARERNAVLVVFVTTDPARDSLPRLRQWLDSFDPSFIGLRGPDSAVAAMERDFQLPPAQPVALPGGGYQVNHSAQVFAFTPDDSAHVIYLPGATSADYAHDIPRLLRDVYK